jgi:hypothetical protein
MLINGWTHQLKLETKEPISDPSWDQIAAALRRIDAARADAFVALERDTGEYIQAFACAGEYMVELSASGGQTGAKSRRIAGVSPVLPETTDIGTLVKHVSVLRGEVLTRQDALALFRAFHAGESMPPEFSWRETGPQLDKLIKNTPKEGGGSRPADRRGTRRP